VLRANNKASKPATRVAGRVRQKTQAKGSTGPKFNSNLKPKPEVSGFGRNPIISEASKSFCIVGVGASAGGLEAFTELLHNLPPDTGMGFVLVQHLDPNHESILPEILARTTRIPLSQVENNTRVERDHIYIIPPNTIMTIEGDVLKLASGKRDAGPHHTIDLFFKSLARDKDSKAIGVILSGSASDGTAGLETIKAEGGITFAQDETTAKYDSMPRSAIVAGCVDFVLPPAQIAQELARIAHHKPSSEELEEATQARTENGDYRKILQVLRQRTGLDLMLYKPATIRRRIARRLILKKVPGLPAYATYLRKHPEEAEALYQDALIGVTSFFRNPEVFDLLKREVFPELIAQRTPDEPVRIWVLGCSTGQEAYSIAMAYSEYASKASTQIPVQIFATDRNEAMLEKARVGLYSKTQVQELNPERLHRFFVEEEGGYRICKPIREMCIFARHDILEDPAFSRMDLVSCRNLLIYLEPLLQKTLIPLFHYALKSKGYLLLGNSETITGPAELFNLADKERKLYRKKDLSRPIPINLRSRQIVSERASNQKPKMVSAVHEMDAQKEADRMALVRYAPAGVMINDAMEVLQFRGQTGAYLEPTPGKVSYNLLKMLREGLLLPVRSALHKAKKQNQPVRIENVAFRYDGQRKHTHVEVVPLKNLKERYFLVAFEPASRGAGFRKKELSKLPAVAGKRGNLAGENERLRDEISALREYLQSVTEQYEAANEELQAANEEAQSSNEELQSINEELETTKEELQSTNEELTTVNEEMNSRNVELHRINSDLNNVLGGVQMSITVLGSDLGIRRFTPMAEKVLNLTAYDVGRPITDIRPDLDFPDLEKLIRETIETNRPQEREVQDKEGRWYSFRALPYKTTDNRIDGAVLVLVDIDKLKRSEQEIKLARDSAQATVEAVAHPLLILDEQLRVHSANRAFYDTFRMSPQETEGRFIYDLSEGSWDIPELRHLLEEILPKETVFSDFEVEQDFKRLGRRTMLLNGRAIAGDGEQPRRILLAIEDITERRQMDVLRESEERFRTLAEALPQLVWTSSPDGECDYFNSKWTEYTGVSREELLGSKWRETLNPADRERTCNYWLEALKGSVSYDLEYRIRRADGEYHWFKVRATPLRDKEGNIVKWFGTCTDIEELLQARDALEKTVQERTARLRQTLADLEAFSYTISHDLRAPLRAMVGFANLAIGEAGNELNSKSKDYLERIINGAMRLDRLIQDVLAYSRVMRSEFQVAPLDIEGLILDVIQQYPGFQPPQLEVQMESPLPKVLAHAAALTQCIANLLSNSVKFVPQGTRAHVLIRAESVDGQVRIWFEDNGIGIEPINLHRIFNMFERVHSSREFEGTGIGLSIVRKAVERMGGTVGVESEPNHGARFWIQLKRAER
jgi:two-component system, chemotaxis family, CheB/CheR fusion protein